MKIKIQTLVGLQDTEIEIHRLEQALAEAPKRFDALTAERQGLTEAVQTAEAHVDELNKRYRELEREARQEQDRTAKRAARLHEVKTNKEYQATLKEIDDIKAIVSRIEDEMLALLDTIETAKGDLKLGKEDFAERSQALTDEAAAVAQAMAEDRKRLEALRRRRDEIAARVDPELLPIYLKAQVQQRDRLAVAGVVNAVCQGCHMNIPAQLYNELQRQDDLKICPLCQRIIYWQLET
ncbi:MAG: C4-type zinc ribbon domain-containing protein [Desulfobacteraceae bacterium]|jgi:predicted  nucleic acid-binding Zn-ribbon protein|nr:C4-type zinc ribbon domain-containing protein [Desulfobacteraceae bacterium]